VAVPIRLPARTQNPIPNTVSIPVAGDTALTRVNESKLRSEVPQALRATGTHGAG
jgi:hypothetical protein